MGEGERDTETDREREERETEREVRKERITEKRDRQREEIGREKEREERVGEEREKRRRGSSPLAVRVQGSGRLESGGTPAHSHLRVPGSSLRYLQGALCSLIASNNLFHETALPLNSESQYGVTICIKVMTFDFTVFGSQ